MAKISDVKEAVGKGELQVSHSLGDLIKRADVKSRFDEVLKNKSAGFIASMLSLVNANPKMMACDPKSILSSGMIAATLDLPINPNLGFAYIIPYGNKATFQIGWKGIVQLAIRTGQYKTMNASEVYEGELKSWNRISGELELNPNGRKSDRVIGYVAFFKLVNGFEKYNYMTVEEITTHARRYSKSFDNGPWKTLFNEMAKKTILKNLLSKYGILSVEMQTAMRYDQGVVKETPQGESVEYIDVPGELPNTGDMINDAIETA